MIGGPLNDHWKLIKQYLQEDNMGYANLALLTNENGLFRYRICWATVDDATHWHDVLYIIDRVLRNVMLPCTIRDQGIPSSIDRMPPGSSQPNWIPTKYKKRHCSWFEITCKFSTGKIYS